MKSQSTFAYLGIAALLLATIAADAIPLSSDWRWLICAVGMVALLIGLGVYRCGRALGALINGQYVMSLSRLQMVLWTILVLSAYAAVVFARLTQGMGLDALDVQVQPELWALIGINTASLVGSPLLLSVQADKTLSNPTRAASQAASAFNEPAASIGQRAQGSLYANASVADARLLDIFEGDELGNTHLVDLAKVQMFFFTFMTAVVWLVATYHLMAFFDAGQVKSLDSLPALPPGMVTLLGVSNGGFLLSKGVSHTPAKT